MNKESILLGFIGLLTGALIVGFGAAYAVNNEHQGMMRMMGMHTDTNSQGMMSNMDMSMGDMTDSLKGKSGDDFDEVFISEMIVHHQGAIDMANLANENAKHNEIKSLAENIITAQQQEIETMKSWQKQWGYETSSPDQHRHN